MRGPRLTLLIALLASLPLAAAPNAAPPRSLDAISQGCAALASNVDDFLTKKSRPPKQIALGAFSGAEKHLSGGPGIVQRMADALKERGIAIRREAPFELRGEYRIIVETRRLRSDPRKSGEKLAVSLLGDIYDTEANKAIEGFETPVFGEDSVAATAGLTLALPPSKFRNEEKRDQQLIASVTRPSWHRRGNRAVADEDSPYGIEIWKVVDGKPRAPIRPEDLDGRAFVEIPRGTEYAVKLVNESPHEAAVRLSIDGLSMFAFANEQHPDTGLPYSTVFVPPQAERIIFGWFRTRAETDAFLVTEYAKSGAAMLKQTANVGTITAVFAASWQEGVGVLVKKPDDEGESRDAAIGDATGFGGKRADQFQPVRREIGRMRAAVSVRYTRPPIDSANISER